MQIRLVAVGKLKEKYLQQGVEEYLKRLRAYARVEIMEVGDEPVPENASTATEVQILEKEGAKIERLLKPGAFVIALALSGEMLTSEGLAGKLNHLALQGRSEITFLIGGSLGLAPSILARADYQLCLSKLTFPHQLVRLIFLEQLYRAFKINRGEVYHK